MLLGLVFTALLVAYLRIDRVRRDAMVWAGATVAGVLLAALVLAPRVDADRPLIDYEAIAASVSKTDGASFNWSHSYGPLNWPRTGRELLRIKTDRAAYWKATNLVEFDGVRWTTGGDRWLPSVDSSEVPDERDSWRQRLLVTVRGLRTTQVIGAGTTLSVANSPRPVRESGPGRFETVGDPLTSGQAYTAEVYVPRAEPPCPGARVDDLPALQPGVPQHGAADAGRRPAVDRRDRELPRLAATRPGSASRRGARVRGPRWTCRRSAATRATAPPPWRPRATRARGISASG